MGVPNLSYNCDVSDQESTSKKSSSEAGPAEFALQPLVLALRLGFLFRPPSRTIRRDKTPKEREVTLKAEQLGTSSGSTSDTAKAFSR